MSHAVQLKIDGRQGAATSLGYSIVESTFVIVKGAIRALTQCGTHRGWQ